MASDFDLNSLQEQAESCNTADQPVSNFMTKTVFTVQDNYTIKSTIEMFKVQKISCAPVIDSSNKIIGIVTGHDLLIQAASKDVGEKIEYKRGVFFISADASLKDILVMFYKRKLKHCPVVDESNFIVGMVARIDILSTIAEASN